MTSAPKPGSVVQGTLDMLILKTVALQPMHGYGVGLRIEQISKGVFQVNAGSLFPAFRRPRRVARHGEQSSREVLHADRCRAKATQERSPRMAGPECGHRANPGSDFRRSVMPIFKIQCQPVRWHRNCLQLVFHRAERCWE